VRANGARFLLKEAVDRAGDLLLGSGVMEREKGWNLLCKFFDNMGPIPHHMHQNDADAARVGRRGKPEAYYFPPQYNPTDNNYPHTFMGLEPGTTKDDVRRCLENWNKGDNGITYLSRAYRLERGTGWQIDPGILGECAQRAEMAARGGEAALLAIEVEQVDHELDVGVEAGAACGLLELAEMGGQLGVIEVRRQPRPHRRLAELGDDRGAAGREPARDARDQLERAGLQVERLGRVVEIHPEVGGDRQRAPTGSACAMGVAAVAAMVRA
jgi:hypothetical protein